jgi:hypothetical protein
MAGRLATPFRGEMKKTPSEYDRMGGRAKKISVRQLVIEE